MTFSDLERQGARAQFFLVDLHMYAATCYYLTNSNEIWHHKGAPLCSPVFWDPCIWQYDWHTMIKFSIITHLGRDVLLLTFVCCLLLCERKMECYERGWLKAADEVCGWTARPSRHWETCWCNEEAAHAIWEKDVSRYGINQKQSEMQGKRSAGVKILVALFFSSEFWSVH